ncbi:hypothetical protein QA648_17860 [Rhizobium sp. CB3171]|uniref:hypothetical protein n=1 Tax=Rhizobium sp. CB3171 TaxID=3039157 RepID=UPI0024B049CB|nr:hypothetical protein [Rhizobium sp. CB3171]WFU01943.1 hypothetical protein QA648_17860 [Rhizobium sp. CB3171]
MKTTLLAAALAATLLPACSSEASSPFAGKSEADIIAYLVFGIEVRTKVVKMADGSEAVISIENAPKPSETPQSVGLYEAFRSTKGEKTSLFVLSVAPQDHCTALMRFEPDVPKDMESRSGRGRYQLDFSGLTSVTAQETGDYGVGGPVVFEGAKMKCVSNTEACELQNIVLEKGKWDYRFNIVDSAYDAYKTLNDVSGHKEEIRRNVQERLNEAVAYYRTNFCKQKG